MNKLSMILVMLGVVVGCSKSQPSPQVCPVPAVQESHQEDKQKCYEGTIWSFDEDNNFWFESGYKVDDKDQKCRDTL